MKKKNNTKHIVTLILIKAAKKYESQKNSYVWRKKNLSYENGVDHKLRDSKKIFEVDFF